MGEFKLEILEQAFSGPGDYSAHGRVRVTIDGLVVTSGDPDYGITQSALALLRTVEEDRTAMRDERLPLDNGFLLCHDCGFPLSFGCTNFGTNWLVRHEEDVVVLIVGNLGFRAEISLREYTSQIAAFAREAKQFYFAEGNRGSDMPDLDASFWAEFNARLERAEASLAIG